MTCRTLEQSVLNTKPVREVVDANRVRTIVADWGTKDPEIGALLDKLQGSRQIPFLAIFPAGHPEKVIRLPGIYSRSQLLDALSKAGVSKTVKRQDTEDRMVDTDNPAIIMSKKLP